MKLLTIQIEKNVIRMTQVNEKGNKSSIEKLRSFDLPDELAEGRYASAPQALADYIASSMEKGRLSFGKAVLLLGASSVIHKEYTHESAKRPHLIALANLEAESILPDDEGEFIIENLWYGPEKNKEGRQTSSIFASADVFITDLVKALKQNKVKIIGAYSTLSVYSRLMKKLISHEVAGDRFQGKTVAAMDLSYPELRLALYHNGQLIHQRMDEQYIEELIRAASAAYLIPPDAVGGFLQKNGLLEEKEGNLHNPQALEETQQAVGSIFSKLLRSINITLNSEGLSLDRIILSGELAAIPGLTEFFSEYAGIPVDSVNEFHSQFCKVIDLEGELSERDDLYQSLLLLGGVDRKEIKSLNFLSRGLKRKKSARRTYLTCALILVATIIVMALLPLNYMITKEDRDRNAAVMETPEYIAMQELLQEQRRVRSQLSEIEAERARLPFGKSRLARYLKELQSEFLINTATNSLFYDYETGSFTGELIAADPEIFIRSKNRLNELDDLKVSVPLTVYKGESNWFYQFQIEILDGEEEGN